jgi:N-acetylmuramoyl-L-alanine amidase
MKRTLCIIFFLISVFAQAQMIVKGADSLSLHYATKMKTLIDRNQSLTNQYSIDLYGVSIYASAADKKLAKPEYKITWSELPLYKLVIKNELREEAQRILLEKGAGPFSPEIQKAYILRIPMQSELVPVEGKPLNGMRIALDPGHFANDSLTSRVEDKYIDFYLQEQGKTDSTRIHFFEAQLTYATASSLALFLRGYGAEVMITIPEQGKTALGKTYWDWKKTDYAHALDSMLAARPTDANLLKLKNPKWTNDDRLIFRYVFRDVELRKRAALINAFRPDLTVIIHYNVDEKNKDWKKATKKNYSMAFVSGSFSAGELGDSEKRFDFLRLLLTDELDQSIAFSGQVTSYFKKQLNVPLAKKSDAEYLQTSCTKTVSEGVYGRNLSLCRLVQGVLIYGETLYQDNEKECVWLNDEKLEGEIKSLRIPRTQMVAEAYLLGILDWAAQQKH